MTPAAGSPLTQRRHTRSVPVGPVRIGAGAPISVQSMTNTDTHDAEATIEQVAALHAAGADIVRVGVPDADAVEPLKRIVAGASVPIVADVHFDHRLAIAAAEAGAAKLRINPGNIGGRAKTQEVARAAAARGAAIRVGVNAGSLERGLREKHGGSVPAALVESAADAVAMLEDADFRDVVVSIKAPDVPTMVEATVGFAKQSDCPLHLGVTEAGLPGAGAIKSAVGIGALLAQGIGDTIRVSLTGDPCEEVRIGRRILQALGLRTGPDLISCPTCTRCRIDVEPLARQVWAAIQDLPVPIRVAVMGCEVNGPGEARDADVGIAGGKGFGLLFRRGEVVRRVKSGEMASALLTEVEAFVASTAASTEGAGQGGSTDDCS
ncbi:MAG: flavodoxin-dependent (E)-4-hydroxy-3-methylbut-2-enyl-diphosphate synthase [Armatimonadota bacterium]